VKLELTMTYKKSTKGTVVFEAPLGSPITTLYIGKDYAPDTNQIKLSIEDIHETRPVGDR